MISGIRSWTSRSSPTASVVRMEQLRSGWAAFSDDSASVLGCQTDHSPAMKSRVPSCGDMKNGILVGLPLLSAGPFFHSYQPSIGTRQRRDLTDERNELFSAALSARALNSSGPFPTSLAHGGTSPQRIARTRSSGSSSGSSGECRLTTVITVVVGATL